MSFVEVLLAEFISTNWRKEGGKLEDCYRMNSLRESGRVSPGVSSGAWYIHGLRDYGPPLTSRRAIDAGRADDPNRR